MTDPQHNIYFYPHTKRNFTEIKNPYVSELRQALSQQAKIVNKEPSNKGFLDIMKYLNKIDIVYFNWIENLPDKKGGMIQSLFLIVFLHLHRWLGIQIIWTLHNKISHDRKNFKLKNILFQTLLKKSDLILTHASEGVRYAAELTRNKPYKPNIHYFPHPAYHRLEIAGRDHNNMKYDLLIWGTIAEYKGIDRFLEFLYKNKKQNDYRILIVGKILSKDYEKTMVKLQNDNILIINEFVDDEQLVNYIQQSTLTLFTYNSDSVLSSGALIFSFTHGAEILGPNVGSFSDMHQEGYVDVFDDYTDLINKIERKLKKNERTTHQDKIETFENKYNWNNFVQHIFRLINKK